MTKLIEEGKLKDEKIIKAHQAYTTIYDSF